MLLVAKGQVLAVLYENPEIQELLVQVENRPLPMKAYNYLGLNRKLTVDDRVTLNTTAVELGLGTGGRHYVIPDSDYDHTATDGHIMKLRYTPWQFSVLAAEEAASPFHEGLVEAASLNGTPVIAAPLHSMLPGVILGFRSCLEYTPKIAYIMTDAAALPLALSGLVRELKAKRLLDLTITAGQAFGGDLEAVSIPSALLTAYQAIKPDLIIVALGPGIVGTGTKLGFSGIEQSWVLDLTTRLGGIPVAVPRVSFADSRERHRGISHHTLTILGLANHPALIGLSANFTGELLEEVKTLIKKENLMDRHRWYLIKDTNESLNLFHEYDLPVTTMGRGIMEDPWFFRHTIIGGILAGLARTNRLSSLSRLRE
ncbi:MAG: DUF3866 family protein [Bacteroidota bacterium]